MLAAASLPAAPLAAAIPASVSAAVEAPVYTALLASPFPPLCPGSASPRAPQPPVASLGGGSGAGGQGGGGARAAARPPPRGRHPAGPRRASGACRGHIGGGF